VLYNVAEASEGAGRLEGLSAAFRTSKNDSQCYMDAQRAN